MHINYSFLDRIKQKNGLKIDDFQAHQRHTESSLIAIVGGLLPTQRMMFMLGFKGISTMLCPKQCMILDSTVS